MPPSRAARATGATAALSEQRGRLRRWLREDDRLVFGLLVLMGVVGSVLVYLVPAVTPSVLLVPLVLTNLLLPPRRIPALVLVVVLLLAAETAAEFGGGSVPGRRWVNILVVVAVGALLSAVALRRARIGVPGILGYEMLVDLQDRLSRHGRTRPLPPGWVADVATRSAGGTSFAGDFMVAHQPDDRRLSLVLVDVSGKGVHAGTRALMLSGALGGLLGAVPACEFMPAANRFLLRQDWEEGFATAVHLTVDLRSGDFELRHAGHPPAIQFLAGSGRWQVFESRAGGVTGPVLGILPDAEFPAIEGRLGRGDALILYTDGLVERPRRDIALGIDRLLGQAERLVHRGFEGAAQGLVDSLGARGDDCALVVLQRR